MKCDSHLGYIFHDGPRKHGESVLYSDVDH